MTTSVITVENLSKRYLLGHHSDPNLRNKDVNLRDAIVRTARNAVRRTGDVVRGRNMIQGDEIEEFWALKGVSFEVKEGEVLGIIGRNGAGKSTLLKIISRITEPTTGEIRLRGRVGSLLEVGTGFHPELSGRDNIFLNGALLGMTRAEIARKFDEIVAFAEIEQFLDTPVKRYSSGMYVRLAFAIAAHLEPEILIIDEVLAVGDAQFQRKCLGKMQDVSARCGRTVLFVSHHMTAIRRLCARCVVLDAGRADGPMDVDTAIEHYAQDSGASPLRVDVATCPRPHGIDGHSAHFREIAVASPGGLRFNLPFAIEFLVESRDTLGAMMVGLAFKTVDGQRILTLDSDGGGRVFELRPGLSKVRFELPRLPLHPGVYQVSATLGSGRHFYDTVENFAVWEVATSAQDHESDRSFGGCRIEPAFQVHRLEP